MKSHIKTDGTSVKQGWILVICRRNTASLRAKLERRGFLRIHSGLYAQGGVPQRLFEEKAREVKTLLNPGNAARCLFVTNLQWEKQFSFFAV